MPRPCALILFLLFCGIAVVADAATPLVPHNDIGVDVTETKIDICNDLGTCFADTDGDGVPDQFDNCDQLANPDQANLDGDSFGDACDNDLDADGLANEADNCPRAANIKQEDADRNRPGSSRYRR
ncbi:MAG: thrombospondin type 3 repeat-containing protein [Deltaproteobacteria bacterium]|nr:thrombospondin type 3 repeat-containing protein [Deltaproteobacteria bacterium]